MKRWIIAVVIALLGAPVATSFAHEGHEHKIMGTVSMRHEFHLEVKATDGKTTVMTLTDKTKVKRGDATAALDSHRGRQVMELFRKVAHERGSAVMVVTHDQRSLDVFDRTYEMEDGLLRP